MKLILILLAILIIYFIFTQTKIFRTDNIEIQPATKFIEKSNLESGEDFINLSDITRSNGVYNMYSDTHNTHGRSIHEHNVDRALNHIRSNFLDSQYYFNLACLPVTNRTPNSTTRKIDKKYINHIRKSVKQWDCGIRTIKLLFIKEAGSEFVVKANIEIIYKGGYVHLYVTFYGKIEMSDDFNGQECTTQLVDLKEISEDVFHKKIKSYKPFATLSDNMIYVKKINNMHQNEADLYD